MKKLYLALVILMTCCACGRVRVRHDHSRQMPQMRMPKDTTRVNDVADADTSWMDDPMTVLPEEPGRVKAPARAGDDIERMMSGEDVSYDL